MINHTSTGNSRIKVITCDSSRGVPVCNTLHVDRHDMLSDNMKNEILHRLDVLETYSNLTEGDIEICNYIRSFIE